MMKTNLSARMLAMLLMVGALISCDKSDDGDGNPTCLILTWEASASYGSGYTESSELSFEYNSNDQLVSLEENWTDTDCLSDGTNCETSSGSYGFSVTYDGDLIQLVDDDGDGSEIYTSADKVDKIVFTYMYDGFEEIDEYRFVYSGDQLSKIENWDNYSDASTDEFTLYGYDELTFSDGNISKIDSYYESSGSWARKIENKKKMGVPTQNARTAEVVLDGTTTFTYDSKVNPVKGTVFGLLSVLYPYFNENNILTETYTYGDESEITTYAYEYDNNDLPVKVTRSSEFFEQVIDFTYLCD